MYTLAHHLYLPIMLLLGGLALFAAYSRGKRASVQTAVSKPMWLLLAIALVCVATFLLGVNVAHL